MARLSIVLVVHREQGFVRSALTSLLEQPGPDGTDDLEVVVVDDAAADHSGEIAAEVAAGDDRVRVLRLDERRGPGPARAAGLAQVTGGHVWFAEPTDLFAEGAVAAVAERLSGSAPEVLVVGHVVRDVYGEERPPAGRPDRTSHLWDKVVDTAFLRGLGPGFDGAGGWEAGVTWPLLLAATRVEVLDRAVYVRRDLPRAVRARSAVGSATDVLDAYDQVLERVGGADRAVVLRAFAQDALRLLGEVPPRRRGRFFTRLSQSWRRHGDDLAAATDLGPAARRALDSGSLRAWQVAQQAASAPLSLRRRARRTVREVRRLRSLRRRLRSAPTRAWYRAQLKAPLQQDLVVYAAYWYTAYSCNPRAIYEKARELAPWLRGVWVVNEDRVHVVPAGVEHVVAGTREYYRVMARATYLVNNVNFPNDIVKRPGQVHLQTHHGTPLKTMGMDLVASPYSRRRMNFPRLMKRVARWDYSISQNVFTTEQWERVYPSGTYESLETGYPRNDVLANATPDDVATARAGLGIEPGTTAVLYTPTHREYHPGYVPQLDPARLAAELGPGHVLLMRTHYFYRDGAAVSHTPSDGVLDVADHPRIEDLYLAADVLVTDYSSVMFDYAVLDRPIVVYAPDWEEYRDRRGTTFDLMAFPPGAVARTEAELAQVLSSRRAWDDESTAHRRAFRARFCSLEDGRASERVVRRLWPAVPRGGQA